MSNFNWVDYTILAIYLISILAGLGRGFIKEVVSLITWIAAFIIATMFSNALATWFTSTESVQNAVTQASNSMGVNAAQPVSYAAIGVSFALLFLGTLIIGAIIGFFLNLAVQVGVLGLGNRLLGGVFGLLRGFIITLVLIFLVQLTPATSQSWWQQSQLVAVYQPAVVWLGNFVSPSLANLKAKFGETIQNVGTQIQGITNSYQSQ